jgi:hypothetical protein
MSSQIEKASDFLSRCAEHIKKDLVEECGREVSEVIRKYEDKAKVEIAARLKGVTFHMRNDHLGSRLEFAVVFPMEGAKNGIRA